MRCSDPNKLIATGYRDFPPPRSAGSVKSSAGPPPADFMRRSAISVISLSTDTGRVTRLRSPAASIAPTKARRLSSAMVNGSDPAGQQLVAHVREPGRSHAGRERLGVRKGLHRLWQVGIGIPMFGHRAPDRREHPAEVEQ